MAALQWPADDEGVRCCNTQLELGRNTTNNNNNDKTTTTTTTLFQ
jgi:hypothetical protein